jgi:hypothetical protein
MTTSIPSSVTPGLPVSSGLSELTLPAYYSLNGTTYRHRPWQRTPELRGIRGSC